MYYRKFKTVRPATAELLNTIATYSMDDFSFGKYYITHDKDTFLGLFWDRVYCVHADRDDNGNWFYVYEPTAEFNQAMFY